jgi:hypothetical protein
MLVHVLFVLMRAACCRFEVSILWREIARCVLSKFFKFLRCCSLRIIFGSLNLCTCVFIL